MIQRAVALMTAEELRSYRAMAGMDVPAFAAGLGVGAPELAAMEEGREVIPARFDEDVVRFVERVIEEMPDPGPLGY